MARKLSECTIYGPAEDPPSDPWDDALLDDAPDADERCGRHWWERAEVPGLCETCLWALFASEDDYVA